MVMDKKLKKIIFSKLYNDLSGVEIIQHNNSIWFIDRSKKYWYLEYQNGGKLYWRYPFFNTFFQLFSIEMGDYEQVIVDWVEEVLNSKVVTPFFHGHSDTFMVEEVLNSKVVTPCSQPQPYDWMVEEVLNFKVVTPKKLFAIPNNWVPEVEEVLNCKVVTSSWKRTYVATWVEEVLNFKVVTPGSKFSIHRDSVEEVLNFKVVTPNTLAHYHHKEVEEVLKGNVVM